MGSPFSGTIDRRQVAKRGAWRRGLAPRRPSCLNILVLYGVDDWYTGFYRCNRFHGVAQRTIFSNGQTVIENTLEIGRECRLFDLVCGVYGVAIKVKVVKQISRKWLRAMLDLMSLACTNLFKQFSLLIFWLKNVFQSGTPWLKDSLLKYPLTF